MTNFPLKTNLPDKTRLEIDRIQKKPASLRTQKEVNFLGTLSPYLTNKALEYENGLIIRAEGLEVPAGLTGFKKGAKFVKTDATGNGTYVNTGTETAAVWALLGGGGTGTPGASTFAELTDGPGPYSARYNQIPRVNDTETGLVWGEAGDMYGYLNLADLTDKAAARTNLGVRPGVDVERYYGEGGSARSLQTVAFDFAVDCSVGDGASYVSVPTGLAEMKLDIVQARTIVAGVGGTMTIQLHDVNADADMLAVPTTIDDGEFGSETAATSAELDEAHNTVGAYGLIRIDVDTVHTTPAKGLIITLNFRRP